jgi:uncharacterized membrane protein YbhN (UPF0104 family)
MAFFAQTQRRLLRAAGADVSRRKMLRLAFEANAVNVALPGGTALSIAYSSRRLSAYGASSAATGFALLASGVLSGISFWMLALTYAALAGGQIGWIAPAAVAVIIAIALVVARNRPGVIPRGM